MSKLLNVSTIACVSTFASATVAQAYYQVQSSGACFTYTAYANSTFMCPDRTFVTAVSDRFEPHERFDNITCCRLSAGPFDVEVVSRPTQSRWVSPYTRTTCPGNGALKGLSFNAAGAPSTIHCNDTSAASRYIYRNDPYYTSDYVINPYSFTQCGYNEVAVGVGDVYSPDGDTDSLSCAAFYMP